MHPQPGIASRIDQVVEELVTRCPGAPAGLPSDGGRTVSVWVGPPGGAAWWTRAAAVPHYAASTMKLPLVVAAYRLAERGELDLDAPVPVHPGFDSAVPGTRFELCRSDDQDDPTWAALGGTLPLRELARRAVVRSGKLAADLLLERVGTRAVAATLAACGCSAATALPRAIGDVPARRAGLDNRVTAADLAAVLGAVATGRAAGPVACAELERVLAGQQHRDQVPAGLPDGTYVAHKTGWVTGVAHDVALVRPERHPAYVVAICTTAGTDTPKERLCALNAAISRAVWEAWTQRGAR